MAKTASNQLGICLRIMHVRRIPKVSIFMAVTTKRVTEKVKIRPKMARFWPKSRYNGRVMAREVFFYQYLWVTKFCAEFGCSRTPKTASVHNSFIVLRWIWKEPAPLASGVSLNALYFKKITVFGQIIRLDGGLHPSTWCALEWYWSQKNTDEVLQWWWFW